MKNFWKSWPRVYLLADLDIPRIIGHRGAAGERPENTMPAFERAVELRVGIELDVWLSADGVPVVIHDELLSRTTGFSGAVYEYTATQLAELDAGSHFDKDFADAGVPTLSEVLKLVRGRVWMDVELKSMPNRKHAEHTGRRVAHLLQRCADPASVSVSSFDPFALYGFRKVAPEFARIQLFNRFIDQELSRAKKLILQYQVLNALSRPDILAPACELVTASMLRSAKNRGFGILAWTEDDPVVVRTLLDRGVDSVITNLPALCQKERL